MFQKQRFREILVECMLNAEYKVKIDLVVNVVESLINVVVTKAKSCVLQNATKATVVLINLLFATYYTSAANCKIS